MKVWIVYLGNELLDEYVLEVYTDEYCAATTIDNWIESQKKIKNEKDYTLFRIKLGNEEKAIFVSKNGKKRDWIRYEMKYPISVPSRFPKLP